MFSCVDYDYDTRFPCSRLLFNFIDLLQVFEKNEKNKSYQAGEAWRTESELRKHEKFSQRATANGAQGRRKKMK